MIPGLDPTSLTDLGQAVGRDPDVLPPQNAMEEAVNWMYHIVKEIGGGNALFALKAAVLTSEIFPPHCPGSDTNLTSPFIVAGVCGVIRGICI